MPDGTPSSCPTCGTGGSDRPDGGFAKTNQADDIRGILAALNLTGPVALAGHDSGSMVAFAWAAAHPEDVSHLILVDPLLPGLAVVVAWGRFGPYTF